MILADKGDSTHKDVILITPSPRPNSTISGDPFSSQSLLPPSYNQSITEPLTPQNQPPPYTPPLQIPSSQSKITITSSIMSKIKKKMNQMMLKIKVHHLEGNF